MGSRILNKLAIDRTNFASTISVTIESELSKEVRSKEVDKLG